MDNLTKEERRACRELEEATDIIIKSSDKGGNTVLLSQTLYDGETLRLLQDEATYQRLSSNPFQKILMHLNCNLRYALEEQLITKIEHDYLTVQEFNIPTLYTIPKLHKSMSKLPG